MSLYCTGSTVHFLALALPELLSGIGIFLVCLGAMLYLLSKADEISKRTKAMAGEKGLEKKRG